MRNLKKLKKKEKSKVVVNNELKNYNLKKQKFYSKSQHKNKIEKIEIKIDNQKNIDNVKEIKVCPSKLGKKYNWTKGPVKSTDFIIRFDSSSKLQTLNNRNNKIRVRAPIIPRSSNLNKLLPAVYDQGNLGSCTANAICTAYNYTVKKQKGNLFDPSRLFLYYNERLIDNSVYEDAGSTIQTGMTAIRRYGICREPLCPYIIENFTNTPSQEAYRDGLNHQALVYKRVIQTLTQLKQCILNGYPFVFGFLVFESFESILTSTKGIMRMPNNKEEILGGHAVLAIGYDDNRQAFIIRNSWGNSWGDNGNFYMPYKFIINSQYCGDFWTVTKVE